MLDNYPDITKRPTQRGGWAQDPHFLNRFSRKIVPEKEERLQNEWFQKKFIAKGRPLGLRHFFPKNCKHAPVIVVNGNHDFTPLGPMFGGDVFQISNETSLSVDKCGLRFGGFPGVNRFTSEWFDEVDPPILGERINGMPDDLDVVVSHMPPYGLGDMGYGEHIGSQEYYNWINKRLYDDKLKMPKLFCFGHAHSGLGKITWDELEEGDGLGTIFSNAATGKQIIEIDV
jgi:Icc-related predicted phosphoesterase